MAIDAVWFAIEQIRRILESMGWKVVAQDVTGAVAKLTIEKPKDKILAP